MVSKQELLNFFQKEPGKYWRFDFLKSQGFVRKVCPKCGKGFWTVDSSREHCPDPECGEEYTFIGKRIGKKFSYIEMWKEFEKFFKLHGHASVPRYPVVARWRDDLYFTIASIVDFQRFDNGIMSFDYPANPLIVPQVCLRFNDIANVGVTGRHHTSFVMPGQHAFNWPKEGYWKEECIELNFEFLTKVLKIPPEDLVYVEELWSMPDFSAFGPYIETYSHGLELVNSGFMEFGWKNGIVELPMKVVDVGWGLERLTWFSNGTPTGYDVVFAEAIKKFKAKTGLSYDEEIFQEYSKLAGKLDIEEVKNLHEAQLEIARKLGVDEKTLSEKIEPVQGMYAILDHIRTLVFAIADSALPSNTEAGYYLRLVFRRAMNMIRKFSFDIQPAEIALWHIDELKPIFPELKEKEKEIVEILEVEKRKYEESKERSRKIIAKYSGKQLSIEDLVKLYDSQGISPEDLEIKTPSEFYVKIQELHPVAVKKEGEKAFFDTSDLPETEKLFYDDIFEFRAKVLRVFEGNWVVLDKTAFYPTKGGQIHDTGEINRCKVIDVRSVGKVIVHKIEGNIREGEEVLCKVNRDRRSEITKHHDAVHVINGLVKKIVGSWCNQAGSEVNEDHARLDITHYENFSEEQMKKIEEAANEVVKKSVPILKLKLPRIEAEKRYGFSIYQGGYVPSKEIRIVEIPDVDVEACGGTHGNNTREIGWIVITHTKKISDSVVRIELKAGKAAEKWLRERERLFEEVLTELNTSEQKLVESIESLFKEWKKLRKVLRKEKASRQR